MLENVVLEFEVWRSLIGEVIGTDASAHDDLIYLPDQRKCGGDGPSSAVEF